MILKYFETDRKWFTLRPIVLFMGLNNTGKTTTLNIIEDFPFVPFINIIHINGNLTETYRDTLLLVNKPEVGLHPKNQSLIANQFVDLINNNNQLIIETHSEHILNRLRILIKTGSIKNTDAVIYYFTSNTITAIEIDSFGELSDYPKDFLDEWSNQLLKLL